MQFRLVLTLSVAILALNPAAYFASPQNFSSEKPSSVVVVELFTSEGCSSCPPADALLSRINLTTSGAGQLIVGISEHVTYWNDLGWKDPFSSQVFTERQNVYASHLTAGGPYTPQMVVNGHEQFVGSDAGALRRALQDDARRRHLDLRILSDNSSTSEVDVDFALTGEISKPLDVIAVLTDDADRSSVQRGENKGRLLQHVSVARFLTRVATVKGDSEQSVHIALPGGLRLESSSGHHLILFAQEQHQGAIIGAVTTPL